MPAIFNTKNKLLQLFLWLMLTCYMIILTKLIIFKKSPGYIKNHFLHHYSWKLARANMHKANTTPFTTIKLYLNANLPAEYSISNLAGNVIGFIPLAIFLPLLFKKLRSAPATIFCILLISLGFEIFQLLSMLGVCDIDDLILNTLGGTIGYFFFWIISKMFVIK